jgi:FkbM family methyltransferase
MLRSFSLPRSLRALTRSLGVDFRRWTPRCDASFRAAELLRVTDADVLLDIGANEGQFARAMRAHGWSRRTVSVEPGLAAHARLAAIARSDPNWVVPDRVAIGAAKGDVDFFVAHNSVSSSMKRVLGAHLDAAPQASVAEVERVAATTLDDFCDSQAVTGRLLLKLDVQGGEFDILRAGAKTLSRCEAVICEVSFVKLYEGCAPWGRVLELLRDHGFEIWAVEAGFSDPETGQMYQADLMVCRACYLRGHVRSPV